MPSFPPPGAVTVCEINRDLVVAEALSDDRGKDAYGDVLGMVFSPIPFQPDALPPIREPPAAEQPESTENVPTAGVTSTISEFFKRLIFPPLNNVNVNVRSQRLNPLPISHFSTPNLLQEFDIQKISWNPHKHCLAFVSGKNQVIVHDFEDSDAKEPFILTSDQQTNVKAVEWRPNSGKMIAVACKGGICLWSASYPGDVPFMKAGVTPYSFSAFPRGSGGRWILVDVLRDSSAEQLLIFPKIYKIHYYISDGTFHFWETNTWTSEPWSSSNGYVSGANWDPEGRVALVSFSNSTTLGSIHFSSKPPSLDAHLLPVELPEISSLIVSRGIEKLAWDASGERLALSFKDGNEMYRGLVAVYDVRRSPLVSVSLVGFIRGPGEGAKPLAFAFHTWRLTGSGLIVSTTAVDLEDQMFHIQVGRQFSKNC
ncbi:aladin-like [Panicum miliaceum]|uniref:Aladin-like n=1 Tax=Panicum miliaceum TaxID=4540 RepID=A0A3L6T1N6_PANMI|nr:aladin-like [Panicum miliaceum]